MALQVSGMFQKYCGEQNYKLAVGLLRFPEMQKLFAKPGVPANETDGLATRWVANLLLRPVSDMMRLDASSGSVAQVATKVGHLKAALEAIYSDCNDPVSEVMGVFKSLLVALEVASRHGGATPTHSPTVVRESQERLSAEAALKTPFATALCHGALGQHLLKVTTDIVATTAADEIVISRTKKLQVRLQEMAGNTDEQSLNPKAWFVDLFGMLQKCSPAAIEIAYPVLADIFVLARSVMSRWNQTILNRLSSEAVAGLVKSAMSHLFSAGSVVEDHSGDCKQEGSLEEGGCPILSFVDGVLGLFGDAEASVRTFVEVGKLLEQVEEAFVVVVGQAGLQVKVEKQCAEIGCWSGQRMILSSIRDLVRAMPCLKPTWDHANFTSLLEEWTIWADAMRNAADDATKAETELAPPVLETLLKATQAGAYLKNMWSDEMAAHFEPIAKGFSDMVLMMRASPMHSRLLQLVGGIVGQAWSAVHAVSLLPKIVINEPQVIRKLVKKETLAGVTRMLFSDGAMAAKLISMGESAIMKDPRVVAWPHWGPNDVARQFLDLVCDAQDRGPLCVMSQTWQLRDFGFEALNM